MSRRNSTSTFTTGYNIMTPRTEYTEIQPVPHGFPIGPQSGKTYKIRHVETRQLLSLVAGQVTLQAADAAPGGGWFWECVETDGWLGFQNTVSGTYLGHELEEYNHLIHAVVPHHTALEYFTVRLAPCGAHYILIKHHNSEDELWKVMCGEFEGNKVLMETKTGGDLWEFTEVLVGSSGMSSSAREHLSSEDVSLLNEVLERVNLSNSRV